MASAPPGVTADPDEELALDEPEAGLPMEQLRGGLGDAMEDRVQVQPAGDSLGDGDERAEVPAAGLRLVEEPARSSAMAVWAARIEKSSTSAGVKVCGVRR